MLQFDEIGYWSEVKLDIVRKYAAAYSRVVSSQSNPAFKHYYVDAFAGAGIHKVKHGDEYVLGSPLNALLIDPPFFRYHFIDTDAEKVDYLRDMVGARPDVEIHAGDCNRILLTDVFPTIKFNQYRRGLCLLDPYGLHLDWQVVQAAGESRTIEIFLNFPVMDMNRNVLWRNPGRVDPADIERMDRFWGDSTWRDVAYDTKSDLFGHPEKRDNETLAAAYRSRLLHHAGFSHVPSPIPMRNGRGATVYFLFFASHKAVAGHIVEEIFETYRERGAVRGG